MSELEVKLTRTRKHLLWSNLTVFFLVLFALGLAMRLVIGWNLRQGLINQLQFLAEAATTELESQPANLRISQKLQELLNHAGSASLVLLDAQGHSLKHFGPSILPLNLQPQRGLQKYHNLFLWTEPVDHSPLKISYIRVAKSSERLEHTLYIIDAGIIVGIVVGLGFSALGSMWLNQRALQPITAMLETLRQFTADASHELRNPLMAILSNVELALRYPDGMRTEDRETFDCVISAASQMQVLTEDLLLLAHLDHEHVQAIFTEVNLSEMVESLIHLYRPLATKKHLTLSAEIFPNLKLQANANHLVRAFSNLLRNALIYTLAGGSVVLRASPFSSGIQVEIEDTGIGIAPEHLDCIFDRFWRADPARSSHGGGSGLGLAIAHSIIQAHGGQISVTSRLGVGSLFRVYLPLRVSQF